jgi:hypothetical protein
VLDFPFCFKQDRMLREMCDLEIWLKSFEVILAELAEQKVLHFALSRKGGSAKNSQLSVALPDSR